MCVRLATRAWERERLRIASVRHGLASASRHHRRRSVVERQTAGATRWTGGERVRVCESVRELDEFDEGGG